MRVDHPAYCAFNASNFASCAASSSRAASRRTKILNMAAPSAFMNQMEQERRPWKGRSMKAMDRQLAFFDVAADRAVAVDVEPAMAFGAFRQAARDFGDDIGGVDDQQQNVTPAGHLAPDRGKLLRRHHGRGAFWATAPESRRASHRRRRRWLPPPHPAFRPVPVRRGLAVFGGRCAHSAASFFASGAS